MDTSKVAGRNGKARRAFNVSEEHILKHPQYDIVLDGVQIGRTGLLVIARLRPKNVAKGTFPEFVLRWDEKANQLDVDPLDVSEAELAEFRRGTSDYYGHHTDKVGAGPKVFETSIGWRGHAIYHGQIRFSLAREVEIRCGLSASEPSISESHRVGSDLG